MPALSRSQQRLFGMALSEKRGQLPHASPEVKKVARSMSEQQLHDFAATRGLKQEHVSETHHEKYAGQPRLGYRPPAVKVSAETEERREHSARGGVHVSIPHPHLPHLGAHKTAMPHLHLPKAEGAPVAPAIRPPAPAMSPSRGMPWWGREAARGMGGFAKGGAPHRQMGGMSEEAPWWERRDANELYHSAGLLHSSIAGRTDRLPIATGADAYVLPADTLSAMGSGNTLAGANILKAALRIGPYGTTFPRDYGDRGRGPPRAPPISGSYMNQITGMAEGGPTEEQKPVSIVAAGGEFVVPREDWLAYGSDGRLYWHRGVRSIGEGSVKRGHDRLDAMVGRVREFQKKWLRSAPPPKR